MFSVFLTSYFISPIPHKAYLVHHYHLSTCNLLDPTHECWQHLTPFCFTESRPAIPFLSCYLILSIRPTFNLTPQSTPKAAFSTMTPQTHPLEPPCSQAHAADTLCSVSDILSLGEAFPLHLKCSPYQVTYFPRDEPTM